MEKDADFYSRPILNSPYERPSWHWEFIKGQPTHRILQGRRRADFVTPVPPVKKKAGRRTRQRSLNEMLDGSAENLAASVSTPEQEYHKALINDLRR